MIETPGITVILCVWRVTLKCVAMARPAQLFAVGLSSVAMILLHLYSRVESNATPSLTRSVPCFVELGRLCFFLRFLRDNNMGNGENCVISRQRPQQRLGKGLSRKFFFFLILGQGEKPFHSEGAQSK